MGTLLLNKIKKQASCFLQEKYRNARIAFTDVTAAELLTEDATNNDPRGPDARTMTKISDASFNMNDYWRIVHIMHKRLGRIDWKHWRQSYKTLILLEFLLTHGPTTFVDEFICDSEVIEELATFKHVDDNGVDWGLNMQKRSDKVMELLQGGETLRQARLKALKTSKEIKGFGNSTTSPSSSDSSRASNSSFGSSYTSPSTPHDIIIHDHQLIDKLQNPLFDLENKSLLYPTSEDESLKCLHLWDCPPIPEKGSLLGSEYQRGEKGFQKTSDGFTTDISSKLGIKTEAQTLAETNMVASFH
ncbi:epsin-3-like [Hibiscus syriacus]|uniref:epsin-3-like n=1 Tax=Hibiscus syriacus TaxID=106335 RepID=UPI001921FCF2|nr:epsin-3-like [Hibiscus syriacus]